MMKWAMIRCAAYLRKHKIRGRIWLTIHDELVFEIWQEHTYLWVLRGLKALMEDTTGSSLKIPMVAEVKKVTKQWNIKQEIVL